MKKNHRFLCLFLFACASVLSMTAQENVSYFLHTVEKGQSLYSIASMYGVKQAEIIKLNPESDEQIYAGHTLRIPLTENNARKETFHTIQPGETLYRLTIKYGTTARNICEANPGLSAENFRIGEVIRIPSPAEVSAPGTSSGVVYSSQESPARRQPVESHCRDMHKVKRKETLYSISRLYNISEAELLNANPELKGENKIKKGAFLCIPYPQTETSQTANTPGNIPTDKELFNENPKTKKRYNPINVAVILPFLNGSRSETTRMVEYYEGFLLAVDSLKREGTSVNLHTYDSGTNTSSINEILSKKELKEMDIIFGPLHQEHIKPLADFSQKHGIHLVIPFTSKDNSVFRNPSIYQINTPQSYLYSEVYDHFARQFGQAVNVIFIESEEGSKEKESFIKGLKEELRNRNIPMNSVNENAISTQMKSLLKQDRTNIFIPTSGNNLVLIKTLPQLTLLVRENPECRINLFGYPEWQTYIKDYLEAFFELDTYFFSSFYTNNLLPASINFTKKYHKWYAKDMDERYPKFGMLGFDTGFFFLKGLNKYGSDFEQRMTNLDLVPIQTGFKFERVNNWGGFINKKVFFVHFTKGYELVKLDFD